MVNSGDVLLRRPAHASPVAGRIGATITGQTTYCNDGDSSGGEEQRTRTPSPTPMEPPTNFDTIIKALDKFSLKDASSDTDSNYASGLPVLEKLARHFILNAFFVDMNWSPKIDEIFTVDSLIADFKLHRHHQLLLGTLLTRLEEPGILTRLPTSPGDDLLDFTWRVGGVIPNPTRIRQSLKEIQTELVLEHPGLAPELNFLNHVGSQLYACIRGRVNAREILWPSKESPEYKHSLLPYYEHSMRVQKGQVGYLKEAVGQFVLSLAADVPKTEDALEKEPGTEPCTEAPLLQILEIGASGSCAATIPVLHHLISVYNNNSASFPANALSRIVYTFTDSSSIALGKAKSILESEFHDIKFEFKVLDLEADPTPGGGLEAEYDIILAVNVLHTAKYLDDALNQLRRLLKQQGGHGILALGELFSSSSYLECSLGVNEGWWRYADRIRSQGPLLSAKQWELVLQEHGFSYVHATACSGGNDAEFGVVLAIGNNNNNN